MVSGIPISRMGVEDKLLWGYTKFGIFSIKNAYYVEHNRRRKMEEESSMQNYATVGQKEIWKINVLGVVKNFLFKASNDILSTRKTMFHRKVTNNQSPYALHVRDETVGHSLWSCAASNDVWAESSSPIQ